MARFICCYSGLEIQTNHFPLYLSARENKTACHPIFHVPQKSLLAYARKWSARELTPADSYLLYVALLRSTDLIYFRHAAAYIERTEVEHEFGIRHSALGTDHIVANNMAALMIAVSRINSVTTPTVKFPEVVITAETATLWNSKHWIDAWNLVWQDYIAGISRQERLVRQSDRELALHKKIESYAHDLAAWADEAACFPTYSVYDSELDKKICLNEYYKSLIIHACNRRFSEIPIGDLRDLLEFCHENITAGSIQSFILYENLDAALAYLEAFISSKRAIIKANKIPISETWTWPETIDDNSTDAGDAEEFVPGLDALVESASIEPPTRGQFNTQMEYVKAKIKWNAANNERNRRANEENSQ
jgi:hypothetical protein